MDKDPRELNAATYSNENGRGRNPPSLLTLTSILYLLYIGERAHK